MLLLSTILTFFPLTIPISIVTAERLLLRRLPDSPSPVIPVYPVFPTYTSPPAYVSPPPYVTPTGDPFAPSSYPEATPLPGDTPSGPCLKPGGGGTATFINPEGKTCTWTGIVGSNFGYNRLTERNYGCLGRCPTDADFDLGCGAGASENKYKQVCLDYSICTYFLNIEPSFDLNQIKDPNKACERERLLYVDSESAAIIRGGDPDSCRFNDPRHVLVWRLPPSPPTSSPLCVDTVAK